MRRTVFSFLAVLWTLSLLFHVGSMFISVAAVLALIVLTLKLLIVRTSFN